MKLAAEYTSTDKGLGVTVQQSLHMFSFPLKQNKDNEMLK